MTTPAVSVILPTYNRRATLGRAVDSVLAQSFGDLELIVVDDGSSDGSAALLAGYSDPRLRVLAKARRGGVARARNDGVRAARAALVAFQDSDDEWLPRKLELQVAVLRGSDAGWVGGSHWVDTPSGGRREVRSESLVRGSGYEHELFVGEPFVTPGWLVRRDHLLTAGLFDENMPCLEDWDLIFKLSRLCRFRAVDEPVLVRHGSPDSLYGDIARRRRGLEIMLERHAALWRLDPHRHAIWCAELGRLCALAGDCAASQTWLVRALGLDPLQPRAVGLLLASVLDGRLMQRLARSRLAPVLDGLALGRRATV